MVYNRRYFYLKFGDFIYVKKIFIIFILGLLTFQFNFGCKSDSITPEYTWTIMIYMSGDDTGLSSQVMADINEMKAANIEGSGINVIALTDQVGSDDTRLYEIKNGDAIRLSSTELGLTETGNEELNMGNVNTLIKFINFCKNNYSTDKYALIVWNHGNGWRSNSALMNNSISNTSDFSKRIISPNSSNTGSSYKAISSDSNSGGDFLFNCEVAQAITGKGIEIIGFDACYMGMLETAYEIRNHAKYMVASEEIIDGPGWYYTGFLKKFKSSRMRSIDFLNAAVISYAEYYSFKEGATLSGVDLSKINALVSTLNVFANKLKNAATNATIRDEILGVIFNYAEDYYVTPGDLNIDIWDMAHQIQIRTNYADSEAMSLKYALEAAVLAEWHNMISLTARANIRSHGLSLHYVRVNASGDPDTVKHDPAYADNYSGSYPVAFTSNTTWSFPNGLLQRIWYHTF